MSAKNNDRLSKSNINPRAPKLLYEKPTFRVVRFQVENAFQMALSDNRSNGIQGFIDYDFFSADDADAF